jgi:hypothetical protein
VRRPVRKRPLGRSKCRWVDNIKLDLRERERKWDDMVLIDPVQDKDQWRAFVDTAMNFWVL